MLHKVAICKVMLYLIGNSVFIAELSEDHARYPARSELCEKLLRGLRRGGGMAPVGEHLAVGGVVHRNTRVDARIVAEIVNLERVDKHIPEFLIFVHE